MDAERASRTEDVGEIIERIAATSSAHIQDRTLTGMRVVLVEMFSGESVQGASARAGVSRDTVKSWRHRYPTFDVEVGRLMARNRKARDQALALEREQRRREKGLILTDDEIPDPGTFAEFRWKYFGRPTVRHQQLVCEALEDESNLYVFIFGPTGMGKDTIAGDYVAYKSAPDRTGLRVAWFMEAEDMSARRMSRLEKYLVDPAVYRKLPEKTPDGQIPTATLIGDYGPFKWEPDMVWADGSEVMKTRWSQHEKYYVRTVAPEQDPNLWATGVEGSTYGSRINLCVCSDIFTMENQVSPTNRANQYRWLDGTLDTRLDEDGRLIIIGTWLPIEHNYEKILENYLADARVLLEKRDGPAVYRKYSSGVATVFIEAIWVNPETGEEESYWPERFPMGDALTNKKTGEVVPVDELSDEEYLERTGKGWKRIRGLLTKRIRSPLIFMAMFQQKRDKDVAVLDFTEETLIRARDETRQFGQVFSHEIKVLGVDPAQRYGAAWVLWAVDKSTGTMTIADFFWGQKLGINGIKDQLILKPLARWDPSWLCYEDNKDGSILGETVVYEALKSAGVSIYPHTTGLERSTELYGPGALAAWMRDGRIKIPYMTREDQVRAMEVESQFKAWDKKPDRSKAGQAGHSPDDIAMAAWVGWIKAGPMIERDHKQNKGLNMGIPIAIRQKFDRAQKELKARRAAKSGVSERDVLVRGNPLDMIKSFIGED
jgi:hypothetical protein